MQNYTSIILGELLSSENETIKRNAIGILKALQKKEKPLLAIKKNLKDGILDKTWNAIMFCPICGAEFSANSGDYWNLPDSHEFKHCGKTMLLVNKST
jgi:hypothetical protein